MRDDFQLPRATTLPYASSRSLSERSNLQESILILLGGSPVKKYLFECHLRNLKYNYIRVIHFPSGTFLVEKSDSVESSAIREYRDVVECIQEVSKESPIIGLIPLIDSIVPMVDSLSQRLNLCGNSPDSSYTRCDKYEMQRSLVESGCSAIRSFRVSSLDECVTIWYSEFRRDPVVLKPPRSGGSDGVRICRSETELRAYFATFWNKLNLEKLRNTDIIMQRYLKGYNTEFIVNTVSYRGKHLVTDIWKSGSKRSQCDGLFLYDYQELVWSAQKGGPVTDSHDTLNISCIIDYCFAVLDSVGMQYGASHMELAALIDYPKKVIQDVVLIEINPRVAGEIRTGNDLIPGWFHYDQIYWLLMSIVQPYKFLEVLQSVTEKTSCLSSVTTSPFVVSLFLRNRKAHANRLSAKILWRIRTELQSFARFGRGLAWINDIKSLDELLYYKQRLIAPRTIDLITSPGVILLVGPTAFNDMQIIRNFECHYLYM